MERSDILRAGAMIIVFAIFLAALHVIHRRPAERSVSDAPSVSAPDDLSAELRRCSALGPQDAEDPHCQAVWKENRARFFGGPARPLLPQAAPATQPMTNATQGEKP
ncbi:MULTISPECIES: putative entry exclusion protein TrbK-alt [Bradyrhizobium]|jgi:conjugative transfer region protein TrbK|uniref:Conjugative transfer region protein TrbK n=2 Tax=Bradyrhizobium elkanii TaxID=29448 RepID=A0A8I1Y582_BRAEL|nr:MULTISPECIES: putative entry exclusion protein TrbK-alt [Bradyrhizobium]MBP1293500.1 conjugative transfer region protein TrbK [Bradyrhizobium elkanii]MCS3476593.1 conjugative transfer region protein TrbK [Bradyrhizobium elkanii]MCS3566426.1 conjugative transfer region protein TrbK [Bradyrhizobium elkanii]MCS3583331.1 conjugative transfer region protein TrbK [Bradyrhizobium elkanii]MCS3716899.1 conjugative transfer region protein TrbK [Bradyrhizobium elkanii]